MASQYLQLLIAVTFICIHVVVSQNLNLGVNNGDEEAHVQVGQSDGQSCQYILTVPKTCDVTLAQLTELVSELRSQTNNQIADIHSALDSISQAIYVSAVEPMQNTHRVHRDCSDVLKFIPTMTSGVYHIQPWDSPHPFYAYCEVNGTDVWTVLQRRMDGSVNFYKDWQGYKNGFGNRNGEFWLGNDNIYYLTSQGHYKLRIDLEDWEGNIRYAEYGRFWIDSEREKFRLHLGAYTGDAGDAFSYHDNFKFTTKDQDNDGYTNNCAKEKYGGWWFNRCQVCSLNGLYHQGGEYRSDQNNGVQWTRWKNAWYSLKKVTMKIIAAT